VVPVLTTPPAAVVVVVLVVADGEVVEVVEVALEDDASEVDPALEVDDVAPTVDDVTLTSGA